MFTRTFAAARLDITLALLAVIIPLVVGTTIGAIVGTTDNRLIDSVWMIVVDAINAFPLIVLAIGIVAVLGQGVEGVLVALAMTNWARYAKLARARALSLREADFIQVTRVLGYSPIRVLVRHVLPNVYSTTVAYALSDFVIVIVTVAGLSFLGLGVRPPIPEWGAMMSEGRLFLTIEWWITVFPGLMLSLTAIGVALIAESVVGWATGEER
jgi:peptide/nickel transport system permease protein